MRPGAKPPAANNLLAKAASFSLQKWGLVSRRQADLRGTLVQQGYHLGEVPWQINGITRITVVR
jgi:hypothetical protein